MCSLDELYAQTGRIGGPGHTIECDEAKFGKRKYNVGRIIEGQWVLGMIDLGTAAVPLPLGDLRVEICPDNRRNAETLIPLIEKHVEPGSTIVSDCWGAYNNLDQRGYNHLTVNHTYNFVDPITFANTQTIESNWRPLKNALRVKGVHKDYYAHHFCEYLWRRHVRRTGREFFESLLDDISQLEWGRPDGGQ